MSSKRKNESYRRNQQRIALDSLQLKLLQCADEAIKSNARIESLVSDLTRVTKLNAEQASALRAGDAMIASQRQALEAVRVAASNLRSIHTINSLSTAPEAVRHSHELAQALGYASGQLDSVERIASAALPQPAADAHPWIIRRH